MLSIIFVISAIFLLLVAISSIESLTSPAALFPSPAATVHTSTSFDAFSAFSVICFVIDVISSMDAAVSSRDDACSEAPSARDCPADDSASDAEATWSEPSFNLATRSLKNLINGRAKNNQPRPITAQTIITESVCIFNSIAIRDFDFA